MLKQLYHKPKGLINPMKSDFPFIAVQINYLLKEIVAG